MARDREREVKMKKNSREFSRNENLAGLCVKDGNIMARIITLFSFLETFRRAGEGVVTEAESGRFLLALRDLRVRTR